MWNKFKHSIQLIKLNQPFPLLASTFHNTHKNEVAGGKSVSIYNTTTLYKIFLQEEKNDMAWVLKIEVNVKDWVFKVVKQQYIDIYLVFEAHCVYYISWYTGKKIGITKSVNIKYGLLICHFMNMYDPAFFFFVVGTLEIIFFEIVTSTDY